MVVKRFKPPKPLPVFRDFRYRGIPIVNNYCILYIKYIVHRPKNFNKFLKTYLSSEHIFFMKQNI